MTETNVSLHKETLGVIEAFLKTMIFLPLQLFVKGWSPLLIKFLIIMKREQH